MFVRGGGLIAPAGMRTFSFFLRKCKEMRDLYYMSIFQVCKIMPLIKTSVNEIVVGNFELFSRIFENFRKFLTSRLTFAKSKIFPNFF